MVLVQSVNNLGRRERPDAGNGKQGKKHGKAPGEFARIARSVEQEIEKRIASPKGKPPRIHCTLLCRSKRPCSKGNDHQCAERKQYSHFGWHAAPDVLHAAGRSARSPEAVASMEGSDGIRDATRFHAVIKNFPAVASGAAAHYGSVVRARAAARLAHWRSKRR